MAPSIAQGDIAPDFTLPDQHGVDVTLSHLQARGPVVLFFYPKDETPGCTAEACSFRDSYDVFTEHGAAVVGVSSDSVASHKSFAQHHQLPFILLSDSQSKVRKLYGVGRTLGILPGRVTYVIDTHGVVQHLFNSQFSATTHIREALTALARLKSSTAPGPA